VKEKGNLQKKFYEHHKVAIEEHIRVVLFGLLCKKNALCAVGEGA
jgi:hypothetical protein